MTTWCLLPCALQRRLFRRRTLCRRRRALLRRRLLFRLAGPLLFALRAGADVLQVFAVIVLAIIIVELFARLDAAARVNVDAPLVDIGLAIRPARMVDVAGRIPARRPVDGLARVDLEQIFRAALLFLLGADLHAGIFDDASALRNLARR